jgi:hypothetical protein
MLLSTKEQGLSGKGYSENSHPHEWCLKHARFAEATPDKQALSIGALPKKQRKE